MALTNEFVGFPAGSVSRKVAAGKFSTTGCLGSQAPDSRLNQLNVGSWNFAFKN
jgi:hypothetical protein